MRRRKESSRAIVFALSMAVALPASAASPEPATSPSSSTAPAITDATTLTWQRLPDDPRFAGKFAPSLTGVAVLADGSIVVLGPRDPMVVALESGSGSNVGSWVLPAGGTAWTYASLEGEVGEQHVSLAGSPTGLVAVSDHGLTWASTDGIAWTPTTVPGSVMMDVIATDTGYASVDFAIGAPALWTTTDGVAWTETKLGKVGGEQAGAYLLAHSPDLGYLMGGGTRGAAGFAPALWSSADGETWQAVKVPVRAKKKHTLSVGDIAAGPAGFLLVLSDHSSKGTTTGLWMSPDGQTWQQVAGYEGSLNAVAAVDHGFVVAGPGVVLMSPDGMTWTTTPEPLFDGFQVQSLSGASEGQVVATGFTPGGGASQAAVWLGTPGAGGPAPSPAAGESPTASPAPAP